MGNSPSTDLGGAELHDRDIEAMDTKDEKSSEVNKLAGTKSKSKDDESLIQKPLQCRPTAGLGESRVSGSERVCPDEAERSRTERYLERTMCPEVSSIGDGETKSTPIVRQRGLWDEDEATGRLNGREEGRGSSEAKGMIPLGLMFVLVVEKRYTCHPARCRVRFLLRSQENQMVDEVQMLLHPVMIRNTIRLRWKE